MKTGGELLSSKQIRKGVGWQLFLSQLWNAAAITNRQRGQAVNPFTRLE